MTVTELKSHYYKDDDTGCWHWSGPRKVWYQGQSVYPHRLLYSLVTHTTIPVGKSLVRGCDSEDCIAPHHHTLTDKHAPIIATPPHHRASTMAHTTR